MPYDYQVDIQIYRAKKANLPATLSQAQWAATLKHFNGRCAYCQARSYECIDHFIPLKQGGGSTQNNCVPACASCNTCKDHPKFVLLKDETKAKEALDRVRLYLDSLEAKCLQAGMEASA